MVHRHLRFRWRVLCGRWQGLRLVFLRYFAVLQLSSSNNGVRLRIFQKTELLRAIGTLFGCIFYGPVFPVIMFFDIQLFNFCLVFFGLLHSVEMRFKRWLRKVWCYFKYYIYLPIWKYVYFPFLKRWRRLRRRWWRVKWWLIARFWDFIGFLERSPGLVRAVTIGWLLAIKRFVLSLKITSVVRSLLARFFRIYFFFINFRRLLIGYVVYDYYYLRLIDMTADPDLRMWNLCVLTIAYNVLYMLMDRADSKLRFESHDLFTRLYITKFLGSELTKQVNESQLRDKVLLWYLKVRFRRNAIICVLGFLYSGQPLFRGS